MKHFLLALAALLSLGFAAPAQAAGTLPLKGKVLTVLVDTCIDDDDYAAPDGSDGASDGAIQNPTLLDEYGANIPPCPVAGVHYAVGPRLAYSTAWKDPLTLPTATPAGGGWRRAGTVVRCDSNAGNGDGALLQGYDLTGWSISNVACTNVVVSDNKVVLGSNCAVPISQAATAVPLGMTVIYNEIDGGGRNPAAWACTMGRGDTIYFPGFGGAKIAKYNYIHDVFQHALSSSNGGDVDWRYNYVENCGYFQGNHCNGTQFIGLTHASPKVWGNVYVSPTPDVDFATTGTFTSGSATITLVTLDQVSNTPQNMSLVPGAPITGSNIPPGTTVVSGTIGPPGCTTVCTGTVVMSANATGSGVASFTLVDVYPSGFVNPVQIAVATGFSQPAGVTSDASVMGNVVIDPGPTLTSSHQLSCLVGTSGGTNTDMRADGNYFDSRGALAALRPISQQTCSGDTYGVIRPNVDMVSGASLPSPP